MAGKGASSTQTVRGQAVKRTTGSPGTKGMTADAKLRQAAAALNKSSPSTAHDVGNQPAVPETLPALGQPPSSAGSTMRPTRRREAGVAIDRRVQMKMEEKMALREEVQAITERVQQMVDDWDEGVSATTQSSPMATMKDVSAELGVMLKHWEDHGMNKQRVMDAVSRWFDRVQVDGHAMQLDVEEETADGLQATAASLENRDGALFLLQHTEEGLSTTVRRIATALDRCKIQVHEMNTTKNIELQAKLTELERAMDELARMEAALDAKAREADEASSELQLTRLRADGLQAELTEAQQELERRSDEYEQMIRELEREALRNEMKIRKQEQNLRAAEMELACYHGDRRGGSSAAATIKRFTEADDRNDALSDLTEKHAKLIAELDATKKQMEHMQDMHAQQVATMTQELEFVKTTVKQEAEREVRQATAELKKQLQELTAFEAEHRSQIEELQSNLSLRTKEADCLREDLADMRREAVEVEELRIRVRNLEARKGDTTMHTELEALYKAQAAEELKQLEEKHKEELRACIEDMEAAAEDRMRGMQEQIARDMSAAAEEIASLMASQGSEVQEFAVHVGHGRRRSSIALRNDRIAQRKAFVGGGGMLRAEFMPVAPRRSSISGAADGRRQSISNVAKPNERRRSVSSTVSDAGNDVPFPVPSENVPTFHVEPGMTGQRTTADSEAASTAFVSWVHSVVGGNLQPIAVQQGSLQIQLRKQEQKNQLLMEEIEALTAKLTSVAARLNEVLPTAHGAANVSVVVPPKQLEFDANATSTPSPKHRERRSSKAAIQAQLNAATAAIDAGTPEQKHPARIEEQLRGSILQYLDSLSDPVAKDLATQLRQTGSGGSSPPARRRSSISTSQAQALGMTVAELSAIASLPIDADLSGYPLEHQVAHLKAVRDRLQQQLTEHARTEEKLAEALMRNAVMEADIAALQSRLSQSAAHVTAHATLITTASPADDAEYSELLKCSATVHGKIQDLLKALSVHLGVDQRSLCLPPAVANDTLQELMRADVTLLDHAMMTLLRESRHALPPPTWQDNSDEAEVPEMISGASSPRGDSTMQEAHSLLRELGRRNRPTSTGTRRSRSSSTASNAVGELEAAESLVKEDHRLAALNVELSAQQLTLQHEMAALDARLRDKGLDPASRDELRGRRAERAKALEETARQMTDVQQQRERNLLAVMHAFARVHKLAKTVFDGHIYRHLVATMGGIEEHLHMRTVMQYSGELGLGAVPPVRGHGLLRQMPAPSEAMFADPAPAPPAVHTSVTVPDAPLEFMLASLPILQPPPPVQVHAERRKSTVSTDSDEAPQLYRFDDSISTTGADSSGLYITKPNVRPGLMGRRPDSRGSVASGSGSASVAAMIAASERSPASSPTSVRAKGSRAATPPRGPSQAHSALDIDHNVVMPIGEPYVSPISAARVVPMSNTTSMATSPNLTPRSWQDPQHRRRSADRGLQSSVLDASEPESTPSLLASDYADPVPSHWKGASSQRLTRQAVSKTRGVGAARKTDKGSSPKKGSSGPPVRNGPAFSTALSSTPKLPLLTGAGVQVFD